MQHLSVAEAAVALDWDADALRRLLTHTGGLVLPGSSQKGDGTWSVPESALRRITGAGLLLFSIPTLANLLDADAGHLRRLARSGKLKVIKIQDIGQRVPWAEYQRLLAKEATA